jgi:hypothetical protein
MRTLFEIAAAAEKHRDAFDAAVPPRTDWDAIVYPVDAAEIASALEGADVSGVSLPNLVVDRFAVASDPETGIWYTLWIYHGGGLASERHVCREDAVSATYRAEG